MRLFFAALPPREIRERFVAAAEALQLPHDARRVSPENYHLTAAFAGEVSQTQAAGLRAVGAEVCVPAFEVPFTACEYWPKSEVVAAVASDCPAPLIHMHRQLHNELGRLGLVREAIAFRAHVTLARKVTQAPVLKAMSPIRWRVNALHLVHSARSAPASVYTVIATWPLLDNAPHGE
jgi:RNA 2',3'-cyclic 3'-phosphodiesterase